MNRVTIASVVEGHGEVDALPVLLRRIAYELGVYELDICPPLRKRRSELATVDGICRAVQQEACRVTGAGGVLVLFDADDDCPVDLVERLLAPAREARADKEVSLVIARSEFESWFLAAASSLRGCGGLPDDLTYEGIPEDRRGAKEWLSHRLRQATGHPYTETANQKQFAARFDLAMARTNSPSFDKFYREAQALLTKHLADL